MEPRRRPGLLEATAVWSLFALVGLAILVTYARLPPGSLYHTSGGGLEGGASRALVFVGFPFALVAVPLAWISVARLRTRVAVAIGLLGTVLCATVGFPGVIDQADLDARPVNALAGIGALLVLGLTVVAFRRGGIGDSARFQRSDWVRIAVAAVLVLAALPWVWAELGYYVNDAPVVGDPFIAEQVKPSFGGEPSLHAVHLGHHHGMDGILLALAALFVSRVPARMPRRGEGTALAVYVAVLLTYGLANALQDGWNEQLVKRGTTESELPSVIRPDLSAAWLGILFGAVVIYFVLFRVGRVNRPEGGIR
jgi:Phosphoglucomutase/phosphomannomutase, alpha/beta/alpha domain III